MLNKKTRYLQVALNSNLNEALGILQQLPRSERIIIEAGTPLIKGYGATAISYLKQVWQGYVVADLKTMDRGETEVQIAAGAGASGAIALGIAPIETINSFISSCTQFGLDSMLDMMNVDQPIKILRRLKKLPNVVILHRGVDEENFNKDKPVPYLQINKIRSSFNVLISVAGGDTIREVQRAVFNDANIVVVWREFYQQSSQTKLLVEEFLKAIK